MNTQTNDHAAITINGTAMTFTICALFQYKENYGAHDWDGLGLCPQYWKNKGGRSVLIADGVTQEMMDDKSFMKMIIDAAMLHESFNEWDQYVFIGIDQTLTSKFTAEEQRDVEMEEWECGYEEHAISESKRVEHIENGRYMDMAEMLGYEA